jgi:hypothetical protein
MGVTLARIQMTGSAVVHAKKPKPNCISYTGAYSNDRVGGLVELRQRVQMLLELSPLSNYICPLLRSCFAYILALGKK